MPDACFEAPVVALLPMTPDGPATTSLSGPREGIHAIYRFGLGGYRFESPLFVQTVEVLRSAVLSPTPENLEAAREALEALVSASASQSAGRPTHKQQKGRH